MNPLEKQLLFVISRIPQSGVGHNLLERLAAFLPDAGAKGTADEKTTEGDVLRSALRQAHKRGRTPDS